MSESHKGGQHAKRSSGGEKSRQSGAVRQAAGPRSTTAQLQRMLGNQGVRELIAAQARDSGAVLPLGAGVVRERAAPTLQRLCTGCTEGQCKGCGDEPLLQRASRGASSPGLAPPIVQQVLRSPGRPLSADTRTFMESRFGQDFSSVRVHSDATANLSARAVQAEAYTVGRDIVFAEGRYAPHTSAGRGILAHELTHVVQQGFAATSLDALRVGDPSTAQEREADAVSRQIEHGTGNVAVSMHGGPQLSRLPGSPAGGCGVCYGSPKAAGTAAHAEIQAAFRALNPTVLTEFPLVPSPTDDNGRLDLAVLTGSNTIHIGEIKPDNFAGHLQGDTDLIWYETQLEKLGFEVKRMILPPPIEGIPFPTLSPPPCTPVQELFVNPPIHGVYTYWCLPDFSQLVATCRCGPSGPKDVKEKEKVREKDKVKEKDKDKGREKDKEKDRKKKPEPKPIFQPEPVLVAIALATLITALSKMKGGLKGRAAGYATAVAAIIVLASGKAEAHIGLDGDDPLEALFKLAEGKGQKLPDDIKDAIRNDPKLRDILSKGAKTGDLSAAQQEAAERLTRLVAEHSDEFTPEELEALLQASESTSGTAAPGADPTVEQLKQAIANKRSGQAGGAGQPGAGGSGQGGDKPGGTSAQGGDKPGGTSAQGGDKQGGTSAQGGDKQGGDAAPGTGTTTSPATTPPERLVEGMSHAPAGPKMTPELREKLLATARAANPPLTDKEVDELLTRLGSAEGKNEDEIVNSVREGITAVRAGKQGGGDPSAPPETGKDAPKDAKDTPGVIASDDAVVKPKTPKTDAELDRDLEKKFGGLKNGDTWILGPTNVAFVSGKPFKGSIIGRDQNGHFFLGSGSITPRLEGGRFKLYVPAGIPLYGSALRTKAFWVLAFENAGKGK